MKNKLKNFITKVQHVVNELQKVKIYWPNGNLQSSSIIRNGKMYGEVKIYYENGNLDYHYFKNKDNQEYGPCIKYFDDGHLQYIIHHVNGVRHGEYKTYQRGGILQGGCLFVNGEITNAYFLNNN